MTSVAKSSIRKVGLLFYIRYLLHGMQQLYIHNRITIL